MRKTLSNLLREPDGSGMILFWEFKSSEVTLKRFDPTEKSRAERVT